MRRTSGARSVRKVSSKRSLSDIASHLIHPRKDSFKDEDLQTLVRLCGKSNFYLPSEYAPALLVLPTCFRATAQYLVQHGTETRGIFRIPGSTKVVGAIYDHYCPTQDEADIIDTTVCSPHLPSHFKASVHDVASAFKKFLAGLPGGILGSLALFDAFVAIHSQLYADPELNRTKQSKVRARLIALAIGTLKSQYRRELICAVFGLLSLIGRAAETAPREDGSGRPLPTSDLMGYKALGNVFGPILVGNLLDSYTMKLANPSEGLILLPLSPPRPRRDRSGRKSEALNDTRPPSIEVDKIQVASSITEMIITHWREVVRHLKSLGALRTHKEVIDAEQSQSHMRQLRPSASESFVIKQPAEWNCSRPASVYSESPLPRQSSIPGSQTNRCLFRNHRRTRILGCQEAAT
ncbi:hypothetical protein BR93DRAFT_522491 [Coniochaeta sp. PMI_546]|nr:hypothetical protein BR93DRAFT_522491 [Coniochaeta sp. PMI_546]